MTQDKIAHSSLEETINSSDEQQLIREDLNENELSSINGGTTNIKRVVTAGSIIVVPTLAGIAVGDNISNKDQAKHVALGATSGLVAGSLIATGVDRWRFSNGGGPQQAMQNVATEMTRR